MMTRLRNERGSALFMGLLFVAVIGGGVFTIMKKNKTITQSSNKDVKFLKGKVETKKIFSVAGFLISNNLILCKSEAWNDGVDKNQCRWFGQKEEDNYQPEDFGLLNLRYENRKGKKVLVFDLKSEDSQRKNNKDEEAISKYPGTVSFQLINSDDDPAIKEKIGETPADIKVLDKDKHLVQVQAEINIPMGGGRESKSVSMSLFKRPLAVPKVTFLNSSCLSQCDSLQGEHSFPACRGPFSIDGESTTDVIAYTYNEGPGVIYDMQYEKRVTFAKDAQGVTPSANSAVKVPLQEFLGAGQTVEWVDKVKCATFVKNVTHNVTKVQTTTNWSQQGTTSEVVDESTTVSQHSEPAGSIKYVLNSEENLSRMEPFRLMRKVASFEGDIGGKEELNEKTVETTITIYVDPPH